MICKPIASGPNKSNFAVALRYKQIHRFACASNIIDANIGDTTVKHRFKNADSRGQARGQGLMPERQNAGKQDHPRRLIRAEEFQILHTALGIVLGVPDQNAVAMRAGLIF